MHYPLNNGHPPKDTNGKRALFYDTARVSHAVEEISHRL